MKTLVFVIESLNLGGAEKSLISLLQNLDDSKYNVDLIYFKNDGFFKNEVPDEVNQIVLPFPKLSKWDRLKYAFKRKTNKNYHHAQLLWPLVGSYLKVYDKKYDIAVAYNQGFATYFTNNCIQAKYKYAWINTDYRKAGYRIEFDLKFYRHFDKIICVSAHSENSFLTACAEVGFKPPSMIIKDIIDTGFVRQRANAELKHEFDTQQLNIVSVGRLSSVKGFELSVAACEILVGRGHPIKWFVVGEGSLRSELEKLIRDKNLQTHFFLLGADPNPYPYIKHCDIFVQTSLFEGLGLTVIEAALLCKPIVSTNFPTVYGIIEDEKTGLIAEMNAVDIAGKIERIIRDVELKKRLIENLSRRENNHKTESLEKINSLFNTPSH